MLSEQNKLMLKEFHAEEIADKNKYCDFAKSIEHECSIAADILRDIAREEQTHANLIAHILDKN